MEMPEILNIDVSVSERDELDKINPETFSKTRNRFI